jgi:hypothetical protein
MVIHYDCSEASNYLFFRFLVNNKCIGKHFMGTYRNNGFVGQFSKSNPIKGNIPQYLYYKG